MFFISIKNIFKKCIVDKLHQSLLWHYVCEMEPTACSEPCSDAVVIYFNIEIWMTFQIILLFRIHVPQNTT